MSSFVHIDNKENNILILGKGATQELFGTAFTAKIKYPINFTKSGKRFVLSLHYNGNNSFLFDNATKIYQFETKDLEIKDYSLCLGNVLKDFAISNMEKNRMKKKCKFFFLLILIILILTIL